MMTRVTALLVRGRKVCMLAIALSALFGGGALLAPATHARPQYIECSSTKAVAMGSVSNSAGTIWVTLDKQVDVRDFAFCGSLRVHAQTRGSFPSGYNVFGHLYYGSSSGSLTHSYFTAYTRITSNPMDVYGNWEPGPCGRVDTVVVNGTGTDEGESGYYPLIYGACAE